MSDDEIRLLRNLVLQGQGFAVDPSLLLDEVERLRQGWIDEQRMVRDCRDEANMYAAKLAKAVEALRQYADGHWGPGLARAVLKELEK